MFCDVLGLVLNRQQKKPDAGGFFLLLFFLHDISGHVIVTVKNKLVTTDVFQHWHPKEAWINSERELSCQKTIRGPGTTS